MALPPPAMEILNQVKPSEHSMAALFFSGMTLKRLDRQERWGRGWGVWAGQRSMNHEVLQSLPWLSFRDPVLCWLARPVCLWEGMLPWDSHSQH